MNKKIIIALTLSLFFCVVSPTNAASEVSILPTNPLYWFKDLGRQIQDIFTFNIEDKIELRLRVAEEKLVEIEKIAENNPNNPNYEKYLEGYETAVTKVQEKIGQVDKNKEEILKNITSKMIDQEQKLEQIKNTIRSDKEEVIDRVKNNIINQYTETSLKIADQNAFQNQLEEKIKNIDENSINRLEEKAPEILKNILNEIEIVQRIKESIKIEELTNTVNKDAAKLGLTPEEILEEVESFSEKDKKILQEFALEILSGNKTVEDFGQIELSLDAIKKLELLQARSKKFVDSKIDEMSRYCIEQGNKVLIEGGVKMCVSPDNIKCMLEDYYNEECSF